MGIRQKKHYLKISDKKKLVQYSVDRFNEDEKNGIEEIAFKKNMPYIMDLTFSKYDFKEKQENGLLVIQFLQLIIVIKY